MWIDELNWNQSKAWSSADRRAVAVNGTHEAYAKSVGNLVLYTVLRAGHSVSISPS